MRSSMPLEHPFRMPLRPIEHPFDAGKIASAAQAYGCDRGSPYSEFLRHNEGAVVFDFAAAVFQNYGKRHNVPLY